MGWRGGGGGGNENRCFLLLCFFSHINQTNWSEQGNTPPVPAIPPVFFPRQERDAKKAAEEEAEARAAEARGLDRRLCVALQVAAHAENTAATCLEVRGVFIRFRRYHKIRDRFFFPSPRADVFGVYHRLMSVSFAVAVEVY